MPRFQVTVQVQGQIIRTAQLEAVMTIGRTPENDLPLTLIGVSKKHAELRVTESGVVIVDLSSEKGTFVAGERIAPDQPVLLAPGAVINIGPFMLTLQSDGSSVIEEPLPELEDNGPLEPPPPPAPPKPPRERWQVPDPAGPGAIYMQDLPIVFHDVDFFHRFLMVFEGVWEPLEWRQNHIEAYFDARTAPREMITWIASWVGMVLNPYWPEERQRKVAREAFDLYRWRGTTYALGRLIELCTGITPKIENDAKNPFVVNIAVAPPAGVGVSEDLLHELILAHKPAVCAYTLEIAQPGGKRKRKSVANL